MKFFLAIFLVTNFIFAGTAIKTDYKWNKTSIKVCWWDTSTITPKSLKKLDPTLSKILNSKFFKAQPVSETRKSIIKNIVTSSYTKNEVGIEFVGWQNCSKNSNNDVIIYALGGFKNLAPATVNIKNSSHFRYEEKNIRAFYNNRVGRSNVALYDANNIIGEAQAHLILFESRESQEQYTDDHLKLNTLHEFGHLAGLRHEHVRFDESLNDKLCQTMPNILNDNDEEALSEHSWFTSRYDQKSIMSYCLFINYAHLSYLFKNNASLDLKRHATSIKEATSISCDLTENDCLTKQIRLSPADKHGLNCLYKFNKKQRDANCYQDFEVETLN